MSEYKPETVLKAAKLVDPNAEWKLSADGLVYYVPIAMPVFFNPLTNPADAYNLMLALIKNKISVKYVPDGEFSGCWGYRYGHLEEYGCYGFGSAEETMLAAVEAMEVGG